jgi:hypothetical protein
MPPKWMEFCTREKYIEWLMDNFSVAELAGWAADFNVEREAFTNWCREQVKEG